VVFLILSGLLSVVLAGAGFSLLYILRSSCWLRAIQVVVIVELAHFLLVLRAFVSPTELEALNEFAALWQIATASILWIGWQARKER